MEDTKNLNVWFPESVYIGWLTYSMVLMTSSLFFYHMTRVRSLELSPLISGVAAVIMMLMAVLFMILGVVVYLHRIHILQQGSYDHSFTNQTVIDQEQRYAYVYLALGIVLTLVEVMIATSIIYGTVKSIRASSSSKVLP